MSSVSNDQENYDKYDWPMAGEDWSAPWGGTRSMWLTSIFPRIGQFLPADRIVEIGCGYGRVAKVLHAFTASELVLFDIADDCVEKCTIAFEESSKTRCLKTDGRSLEGVDNYSVDLVLESMTRIKDVGIHLYEEPLPPQDVQGYRALAVRASIPVATGEALYTVHDFARLMTPRAVDTCSASRAATRAMPMGERSTRSTSNAVATAPAKAIQ